MKPKDNNPELDPEQILDSVFAGIREEPIPSDVVEKAAERAWDSLAAAGTRGIHGCADFRAMMPAYRDGTLSPARSLLLKDHLRECVACRKEYAGAEHPAEFPHPVRRPRSAIWRWAVAAVVALVVAGPSWYLFQQYGPPPAGPAATVASVDGSLYRVASTALEPLARDAPISAGETIRVPAGEGAMIRLRDGSTVELRERSHFSILETRRDVTIRLERGSVIVEAAERTRGHLFVSTPDCRVAVTGTVFSVLSGLKGSRVSVIAGEVQVDQSGHQHVLHAGEQLTSNSSVETVAVSDEISWSRHAARHLALLGEMRELADRLDREVRLPDLRYSGELLGGVPPDTAVYFALPNLGETLAGARRVIEQQVAESSTLSEWWSQSSGEEVQKGIDRMRRFAAYFGDEVAGVVSLNEEGRPWKPVFLTTLVQRGFPEFVTAEMNEVSVRVFTSSAEISSGSEDELLVYVSGDKVAMSPEAGALSRVADCLEGACGAFDATGLGRRVRQAYADGVGVLVAADLERLGNEEAEHPTVWGNMQDLVFVERLSSGQPDTRAIISFRGERQGISSWLAAPSPIGALEFVSPEAMFVAAAAATDVVPALDELLENLPEFADHIGEAENELGLSVRYDVAATLGAEVVFAVDGALVPVPSWKFIAEVYDRDRLQWSIVQLVDSVNRLAAEHGRSGPTLTSESTSGRVWYTLTADSEGPFSEIHYVFVDGYLLAAPSRTILERAIENRTAGVTLTDSERFRSLFPRDHHADFSAIFYHDFEDAIDTLRQMIGTDQQEALGNASELVEPALVVAFADDEEITLATSSQVFSFTPSGLLGLRIPGMIGGLFGRRP